MLFHVLLHFILNNKSILLFEDRIGTDGSVRMDLELSKIREQLLRDRQPPISFQACLYV